MPFVCSRHRIRCHWILSHLREPHIMWSTCSPYSKYAHRHTPRYLATKLLVLFNLLHCKQFFCNCFSYSLTNTRTCTFLKKKTFNYVGVCSSFVFTLIIFFPISLFSSAIQINQSHSHSHPKSLVFFLFWTSLCACVCNYLPVCEFAGRVWAKNRGKDSSYVAMSVQVFGMEQSANGIYITYECVCVRNHK